MKDATLTAVPISSKVFWACSMTMSPVTVCARYRRRRG
jgi:hypothetical protein